MPILVNQQNAAYFHNTGAVHVWVKIVDDMSSNPFNQPASGTIYYVGTCETNPVNSQANNYRPVFTSTGGPLTAYDKEYLGSEEMIVLDLNRFNHKVTDMLESAPQYGRELNSLQQGAGIQPMIENGSVPGMTRRLDRGSLLIANLGFFQMWLQYSFYGTDNATPDLPPGWFYFACSSATCYTPKQGGRTLMKRLVVEATNLYDDDDRIWGLKTNDPDAFNPINGLEPI